MDATYKRQQNKLTSVDVRRYRREPFTVVEQECQKNKNNTKKYFYFKDH